MDWIGLADRRSPLTAGPLRRLLNLFLKQRTDFFIYISPIEMMMHQKV